MSTAYLLLGSNLDNRLDALEKSRDWLSKYAGRIIDCSSVYESEPWGFESDVKFLNQVVVIETSLDPPALLDTLLQIEKRLGRMRKVTPGYESRTIDIDILFYDDRIILNEQLTVPHPRLHERRFALVPLTELNGELVHPVLGKSVRQLSEECTDTGEVVLYSTPSNCREER